MANVSIATVSRALNAPDVVRAETRARVEAAVTATGYTPNFSGRALVLNRTNTVGVVIPTMDNAIFAQGLQALQETLADAGVTMLVATSHYSAEQEAAQIRTLLARGVDALALIGEARPPESYQMIERHGVPFVLMWVYGPQIPHLCVGFDNRGAARKMTELVLAAGHRRIAMIAGLTAGNDRAAARIDGVRDALAAERLTLAPDELLEAPYDIDASASAARQLLSRADPPTAIVCGNDVIAVGAIRGALALGLGVPRDVSIVGFDDIDLATVVDPPLTTVRVPHRRMGRAAAELLLAVDREGIAGTSVAIETSIVERASLAPPRTAPVRIAAHGGNSADG